ncbi:VanZ family protein [Candidatus Collierbacteria bacterium]|nr:VanZ family protein [Candidatus Collierbacteria bacterium]
MKNFINRYFPVIAWAGLIFFFSSLQTIPSPQDTILNFILKKTAHIIEYSVLYWLTFRAINWEVYETSHKKFLTPLIFTFLYAIFDEVHQSFVPNRHAKIYDVGFDLVGALLAIFRIYRRRNSGQ